jgi:hypothetical protein
MDEIELRERVKFLEKNVSFLLVELAKKDQQLDALQEMQSTIEVQKREIKELKTKYEALKNAIAPVTAWWCFVRVGAELEEYDIKPEYKALHYMGNGGSTTVTAAELDKIAELSREE